ncbi:hypothetical protein LEP1GSC050_2797 [Leptospira broomii serovar Hurstbridge str. 5399]|uniref:Uncharacterized protein n=1 Tax=Leptospira broomii serovar Hurstbridge str. 5399 TaxID=1049789 RepID=T0F2V7_9LEPT|nr:hypothetical protein LEP1GSC050_2797 [Leptospira broomii serovar Hurstbridge str. 5399]
MFDRRILTIYKSINSILNSGGKKLLSSIGEFNESLSVKVFFNLMKSDFMYY